MQRSERAREREGKIREGEEWAKRGKKKRIKREL